jgi:acyl-CoA dehydrogenase
MTTPSDVDDEHRALQAVCRTFVADRVSPLVAEAEASRSALRDLWAEMGGAGLLGLVTRHCRDGRTLRIGGGTDEIQLEILSGRLADA